MSFLISSEITDFPSSFPRNPFWTSAIRAFQILGHHNFVACAMAVQKDARASVFQRYMIRLTCSCLGKVDAFRMCHTYVDFTYCIFLQSSEMTSSEGEYKLNACATGDVMAYAGVFACFYVISQFIRFFLTFLQFQYFFLF